LRDIGNNIISSRKSKQLTKQVIQKLQIPNDKRTKIQLNL